MNGHRSCLQVCCSPFLHTHSPHTHASIVVHHSQHIPGWPPQPLVPLFVSFGPTSIYVAQAVRSVHCDTTLERFTADPAYRLHCTARHTRRCLRLAKRCFPTAPPGPTSDWLRASHPTSTSTSGGVWIGINYPPEIVESESDSDMACMMHRPGRGQRRGNHVWWCKGRRVDKILDGGFRVQHFTPRPRNARLSFDDWATGRAPVARKRNSLTSGSG